jgi:phage repressor protein C with HTH and peptisase S24 domain
LWKLSSTDDLAAAVEGEDVEGDGALDGRRRGRPGSSRMRLSVTFRARAEDLYIVTIDGDSMEPLLSSGDRIVVDTSQRVPVPLGIFVIWDGMGVVAKRVEHLPHSEPPRSLSSRSIPSTRHMSAMRRK